MTAITRRAPPGTRTPSATVSFRCLAEQRERYIRAARTSGTANLSEWCADACDFAAKVVEDEAREGEQT